MTKDKKKDSKHHVQVPSAVEMAEEELREATGRAYRGRGSWDSVHFKRKNLLRMKKYEDMLRDR